MNKIILLLTVLLTGCAGGAVRHADLNRDYARNCGATMDELGLCGPFDGRLYQP